MKKKIKLLAIGTMLTLSASECLMAETRQVLLINKDVTTHIIMPENLKLVDISTERIVGDQCADNMLRIKPIQDSLMISQSTPEGEYLGAVTLIGERHIAQFDLKYTNNPTAANSLYKVNYDLSDNYANPETAMTEAEMANYAWSICNTKKKFHTIRTKSYGLSAQVNNIYSIGNFFFIDLSLNNKTKVQYDIAQMRLTLADKKETKATNSQTLELTPSFVLNKETSFKKQYRQVIVLPKLTYPEEKILNIEISEDQISGRVITIPIQYEDMLNADCFNGDKSEAFYKVQQDYAHQKSIMERLEKDLKEKQKLLDKANSRLNELQSKLEKKSTQYLKLEKKLSAMIKAFSGFEKIKEVFPSSLAEVIEENDIDNAGANQFLTLEE